jgi:hypothetical protein
MAEEVLLMPSFSVEQGATLEITGETCVGQPKGINGKLSKQLLHRRR